LARWFTLPNAPSAAGLPMKKLSADSCKGGL
jgi:hypothetical protein